MAAIDQLLETMTRLRAPGGCPWDREQTLVSLRSYLLEEAYEVAEAIDLGNPQSLCEELGDLLLQVVFQAEIARENGWFDFDAVAATITAKLVRRHPHVFGDDSAGSPAEAWQRWDAIKAQEKGARGEELPTSRLDGIPAALPALARAQLLVDKAARAGFDWPDQLSIVDKVREETDEVAAALTDEGSERVAEELGDLLFATTSLARKAGLDPEACLAGANRKFIARFRHVEAQLKASAQSFEELSAEQLDRLWRAAK